MTFCYANIIRVVWRRAGPVAARNIDEPRIHYVASCRREVASYPAACIAEIVSGDHQPRPYLAHCHSLPVVSHVPIGESRRMTLTTKRSVVRMAMSVTIGFMTCFIPYIIVSAVRIYSDYYYTWPSAYAVSSMMALSHSAVNPLLYIIFSKRAVDAAFDRLRRRAKPRCCQPRWRLLCLHGFYLGLPNQNSWQNKAIGKGKAILMTEKVTKWQSKLSW